MTTYLPDSEHQPGYREQAGSAGSSYSSYLPSLLEKKPGARNENNVASAILGAYRRAAYTALREVIVEEQSERLILRGTLPSYYLKQMAQTLALEWANGQRVVNGIVVASLPAASTSDRNQAHREDQARLGQVEQIGESRYRCEIVLGDGAGLHARPAARIVGMLKPLRCEVSIRHGEKVADAHSILELLSLGAEGGATLVLVGNGPDAPSALRRITELLLAAL